MHLVCQQHEAKKTQLTKLLSLNLKLAQDKWLNVYLIVANLFNTEQYEECFTVAYQKILKLSKESIKSNNIMIDIVLLGIDAGIEANMDTDLLIEFGNIIAINSPQFLCRKAKIVVIEFDNTSVSEMLVLRK
jgi:hypothetical protein